MFKSEATEWVVGGIAFAMMMIVVAANLFEKLHAVH